MSTTYYALGILGTNKKNTNTFLLKKIIIWSYGTQNSNKNTGPSCTKHHKLNKPISGQNVTCSTKCNIQFTGIFDEKM